MSVHHTPPPLLPRRLFLRRLGRYAIFALILVCVSWGIGILGYRLLEHMTWIDAVLNSAMLLGGMGPVDRLQSNGGKLFASFYAMFSGLVFLVSVGLLVSPILHRMLHNFHIVDSKRAEEDNHDDDNDDDDDDDDDDDGDDDNKSNNTVRPR